MKCRKKVKKNRAFTLLELLSILIIIGLLLIIVVPTIQKYLNRGKENYYSSLEGEMKSAGMEYLESYRSLLPKENGNVVVVSLSELVANKYIDEVKDEKGQPCTGQVAVKRIKNKNYEYYSCLQCGTNGKYYSTGDKIKTATGEEVSVCSVDDSKNVYVDSDEYIVKAPCDTLGNCDVKSCTDVKNCTNPDPPVCTSGTCSIKLDINARTITVEQGIGMLKLPYGKVYYKNNPEPIKTDLMGSPSMVDISKLGRVAVTYSYRGQNEQIYVNVIDKKSPEKPSIALRKNNVFGATYDQTTLPWFSGNIFATFRSTDYAATGILGSGLKEYRVYPGTDGQQVTSPLTTTNFVALSVPWETMTKEGEYTRYITAIDNQGNESAISQYTYRIDKTNPFDPTYRVVGNIKDGWYKTDTTVIINHNGDNLKTGINKCSGVNKVTYSIKNNTTKGPYNFTTESKDILITEDGETEIFGYVTDNAGNISNTTSVTVKVDQTIPKKATISPNASTKGNNGWYINDVTVTVTHNGDDCRTGVPCSGFEYMTYKITGSQVGTSSQPLTGRINNNGTLVINSEGTSTITVYTYDLAGNVNSQSLVIKLDKTPPAAPTFAVSSTITKSAYGWYNQNVPITINTSNDPNTGVIDVSGTAGIKYKMDGAQSVTLTTNALLTKNVTVSNNGTSTVYAYAYDAAGNTSAPASITINKDSVKPGCVMTNANTAWAKSKTLTYNCSESSLSGCVSTTGSGTCSFYYSSTTGNAYIDGSRCTVTDKAGNTNTCPSDTYAVKVDTNSPTCTISYSSQGSTSGVTTTVNCSDTGGSGCNTSTSNKGETGLKSSKTYTVYDNAGNSGTCTATVTSTKQYRKQTCSACNTKCTKTEKECVDGWYYLKCSCDNRIVEWDPPSAGHNYSTSPSPSTCVCADGNSGSVIVTSEKGCNEYKDKCVEETPDCSLGCSTWSSFTGWNTTNKCGSASSNQCKDESRTIYNGS